MVMSGVVTTHTTQVRITKGKISRKIAICTLCGLKKPLHRRALYRQARLRSEKPLNKLVCLPSRYFPSFTQSESKETKLISQDVNQHTESFNELFTPQPFAFFSAFCWELNAQSERKTVFKCTTMINL